MNDPYIIKKLQQVYPPFHKQYRYIIFGIISALFFAAALYFDTQLYSKVVTGYVLLSFLFLSITKDIKYRKLLRQYKSDTRAFSQSITKDYMFKISDTNYFPSLHYKRIRALHDIASYLEEEKLETIEEDYPERFIHSFITSRDVNPIPMLLGLVIVAYSIFMIILFRSSDEFSTYAVYVFGFLVFGILFFLYIVYISLFRYKYLEALLDFEQHPDDARYAMEQKIKQLEEKDIKKGSYRYWFLAYNKYINTLLKQYQHNKQKGDETDE